MLEELLIKDFQTHRRLRLALDPHVTVLVGESAAGKSSVLRALRWVLTNRPLGEAFVGRWGKAPFAFGRVKIDGHAISRKRGSGANWYKLDGRLLKAFGSDPPQPVADLANVNGVNFQGQFDAPYWFLLPPSQVSKELNGVINLGSIDKALALAAKDMRRSKAAVDVSRERLATARRERDDTKWATEFSLEVNRVTALSERVRKNAIGLRQTQDFLSGMVRVNERQDRTLAGYKLAQAAHAAATRERQNRLAIESMTKLTRELRRAEAVLAAPVPSTKLLDRLRAKAKRATREAQELRSIQFGLENTQWEIDQCQREIEKTLTKVSRLAGSNCPACGRPLPSRSATCNSHTKSRGPGESPRRSGMIRKPRTSANS